MKKISILYLNIVLILFGVTAFKAQDDLRPNSYIFDVNSSYDGLKIPVAKAYEMWQSNSFFGGNSIPSGTAKAYVYWEDQPGLIKSNADYELTLEGSGNQAKIIVPVNKFKEGNALISYEVGGVIYWSWHVWVTDDPTQDGSNYISVSSFFIQQQQNSGTITNINPSDWKWMDRNLGATSASLTGPDWNKNGGLLYQWGRKDPIPPLATKGDDFYEVSGKAGRIRHAHARNFQNGAVSFENLKMLVNLSNANINANIQLATNNPLSLIYVVNDGTTSQAFYNNNANLPVNWFGTSPVYTNDQIAEHNLWSDNSMGIFVSNYNNNSNRKPYRNKSAFDPCPNGWRVPSMLTSAEGNSSYYDDVRSDYSPYGYHQLVFNYDVDETIRPTNNNMDSYQQNIKAYPQIGFDLSNASSGNMGVFPGTGVIYRDMQNQMYTDQHETYLWTATMTKWGDVSQAVNARAIRMVPDAGQNTVPDSNYPTITGKFTISNTKDQTSNAYGVRCVKDPLYIINNYDFPTEYYTETSPKFDAGLDDPNTYVLVKSSSSQTLDIPIRKAFSVQSNLLNNPAVLNSGSFDNLKVNVLWTTNPNLVQNLSVAQPGSVAAINGSDITVTINPNESGNAVVTLHNGDIANPVLWSWHVWVTNTPLQSIVYQNDTSVNPAATNYVNYIKNGTVMLTEIMDRNLGATDHLHWVDDPGNLSTDDIEGIKNSGGLQYQWGRKDPLPSFTNPNGSTYVIYLGNNSGGSLTYTSLDASQYITNYTNDYITYAASSGVQATDPIAAKIAKVIGYSVSHPLEFLKPSSFASQANPALHTNGTDWISPPSEPNLAADRWGRGEKNHLLIRVQMDGEFRMCTVLLRILSFPKCLGHYIR